MDMTQYSKKDTPAQARERLQWQLDTVRVNQTVVYRLLGMILDGEIVHPRRTLANMHKNDRDALLQPNGILTSEQIELLS